MKKMSKSTFNIIYTRFCKLTTRNNKIWFEKLFDKVSYNGISKSSSCFYQENIKIH